MTSSIPLSCPNSMASLANLWPAANCTGALLLHVAFFFLCGHQGPQSGDFFSFFGVVGGGERWWGARHTPGYLQTKLPKWESVCYYFVFSRYYKLARRPYDILSPSLVI